MSIVALKKLSLIGLKHEKNSVLEQLQALGCIHLMPLNPTPKAPESVPPEHAENARKALRYLMDVPQKRHQVRLDSGFNMGTAVFAVLANQHRLRDVMDRRDALRQRIRGLAPWGDFELPRLEDMGGQRLWFYVVPQRQLQQLDAIGLPWQVVHTDFHAAWVVLISPDEPPADAMPAPRVRTGARSLSELRRRLEETELELEDIHAERQSLTRWIYQMSYHLAAAEDAAALKYAKTQTLDAHGMFALQGWLPAEESERLTAFAEQCGLALTIEEPAAEDKPPTLLDNPESVAAGEDLVGFYQMPGYRSWDPSRVLFFSFALFFAMILSDAGYAALLGIGLAAYWRRMGRSDKGRRFRLLSVLLVSASVVWGVLVGSYFGFALPDDSLLGRLAVLDLHDFDSMMRLSVGIGVLHLLMANAQRVLLEWGRPGATIALGWISVLLGGYVLWLGGADSAAGMLGKAGIGFGLLLVLFMGSERKIENAKSALLRLLDGLRELSAITQIFGDVLSYLRLFALGLASASLALTFNDLARQVNQEVDGLGLLFAILIMLVGHALNLALGIMSGVVHGLRLNYIEFYNWALSGEGYPFRAFSKKELQE